MRYEFEEVLEALKLSNERQICEGYPASVRDADLLSLIGMLMREVEDLKYRVKCVEDDVVDLEKGV